MTRTRLTISPIVLSLILAGTVSACGDSGGDGTTIAGGTPVGSGTAAGTTTAGAGGTTTGTTGDTTATGTTTTGTTGDTTTTGTTTTDTTTTGTTTDTTGNTATTGTATGTTGDTTTTDTTTTGTATGTTGGTTTEDTTGVATGDMGPGDTATDTTASGDMTGDMGSGDMATGDMATGDMGGGDTATDETATDDMGGGDMGASGATGSCSFTIIEDGVSSAIGSVGIVRWSASETVSDAEIDFDLADGSGVTLTAPVDLAEADYRTLLLGMKAGREYVYRIKINGGSCVSEDYPIETDPAPNSVPIVDVTNGDAGDFGFIVTSAGLGNMGGFGGGGSLGGGGGSGSSMYIFDTDGDIVWWTDAPGSCSRARMDYEGKNMWMTSLNYPQAGGEMRYVSMDGLEGENNVQGLNNNHHDFTVVPGGIITSISWGGTTSGGIPDNQIIERSPDGSLKTIVESVDTSLYTCMQSECHGNSISYHAATDTYVMSDRYPNLYVNFDRDGNVLWQVGGSSAKASTHYQGSWSVNHGHHFLDNGNLLIFNNAQGTQSPAIEFELSGSTANEVWRFVDDGSTVLGDVQRLPNGNTLITYSNRGRLVEVNGNTIVREYTTGSLGYAIWRPTLYGPPPK